MFRSSFLASSSNRETMMMKIRIKDSTLVRPAAATPRTALWLSNLDLLMPMSYHTLTVRFYPFNGDPNFFDSMLLKNALSRALVPFYPVAGRLKNNTTGNHRLEIDCNGEGVLFVDAEFDGRMDDLEDFYPKPDLHFCPQVDYSLGISSYPLSLVQATRFKCGGVCLGIANEHHLVDGISALHFINTWSDMARGRLDVKIPPFFDKKAVLSARNPPQPQFTHIEFEPYPTLKSIPQLHNESPSSVYKRFELTPDLLNVLKAKCNNNTTTNYYYTTFEVVAAHVWRCITKARQLRHDQLTKLYIPVDGRSRLRPPLPQGYFGNVVFTATPIATAAELASKPLRFSVDKIHTEIARFDHEYCTSALDYLELQDDVVSMARGSDTYKSPNLMVVWWGRLPFYGADFGWGRPAYFGQGGVQYEGMVYVMGSPSPGNDGGSIWCAIALPENQMRQLERVFYEDILGLRTAML